VEWFEVYDFIEFVADPALTQGLNFFEAINFELKREVAGYRIVNDCIVQITAEEEIQEIEEVLNVSEQWNSFNSHIRRALELLADSRNKDYRNSIKESISAVESLCIIMTGDSTTALTKALAVIEKSIHYMALSNQPSLHFTGIPVTQVGSGMPFLKKTDQSNLNMQNLCWWLVQHLLIT
jgi:hypothetical protein